MKIILGAAFVLVLIKTYDHYDRIDTAQDQAMYCSMVHDRAWPDFRRDYKQVCTKHKDAPSAARGG